MAGVGRREASSNSSAGTPTSVMSRLTAKPRLASRPTELSPGWSASSSCFYDNGGDARSTSACDPGQPNQRWEVIPVVTGRFVFRNLASRQCLTAQVWTGVIGMNACDPNGSAQQWNGESYSTGGLDPKFPMRLHSAACNYCAYTDFTADVFATQGNCGLLGTEDNRKIGLSADGNFSLTPPQP